MVETALPEFEELKATGALVPEAALANIDRESVSRTLAQIPEEQRLAIVLMDW